VQRQRSKFVHITGAAGSGTSTLGRALAAHLGAEFVDADDFYWLPTDPPYSVKRARSERIRLLSNALERSEPAGAVLSGSVVGWGDDIVDGFDLIVFLVVPTEIRIERLRRREEAELGVVDEAFIAWAMGYDDGVLDMRSRALHESWLASRAPSALRIEGAVPLAESMRRVLDAVDPEPPVRRGA
jgi:adenylate kinase family enzyme